MGLINLEDFSEILNFRQGVFLNAKLFVFKAGTDSLSPIYQDRNLTLMQQNPLLVHSNASIPTGYLIDGEYKFIIRDSSGEIIDELDNITVNSKNEFGVLRGFRTVAELSADSSLTYSNASVGDIISVADGSFLYEIASEAEASPHLSTAGGVQLFVKAHNGEMPLEAFGSDYDTALEHAIVAAAPLNAVVVHKAGGQYVSQNGVTIIDTPVRVDFRGCEVTRTTNNASILEVIHSYVDVTPVADITTATVDFGGGGSLCQRVHLAPNAAIFNTLKEGDVIKLVSDQFIPSSPLDAEERLGELMSVAAVDANAGHVDLFGMLRENFVLLGNNVRLALACRDACQINGLRATSSALYEPLVRVTGAVRAQIDIKAKGAYCPALELLSCFRPVVKVQACGLMTNETANQYGYGVVSYGCKFGRYDVTAEKVRHAWTSGARGIATAGSSEIARFGASIDEHVFVDTTDCYGPGFDTHSDALGTVAKGVVRNAFPGDSTSNTCVQVRGRDCDVDITTIGLRAGRVHITGSGGGHRIRLTHQRPHDFASTLPVFCVDGDPNNDRQEVHLEMTNTSQAGQFPLISATDCCLLAKGLTSKDKRSGTGSLRPVLVNAENAEVTVNTWSIDWASGDGNLTPALARVDGQSAVTLRDGIVKRGNSTYFLADLRNSSGSVVIDGLEVDHMPNLPVNSGTEDWQVRRLSRDVVALEEMVVENGNSNGAAGTLEGRIQMLSVPLTTQRTISLPTDGVYAGMRFDFIRTETSTGSGAWLVTAGGGVSFALYTASRLSVIHDGTKWEVVRREGFQGLRKRGDESPVMTGTSETTQIFDAPITMNRTLHLPDMPGTYAVRRSAAATGGFNLTVNNAAGSAIHVLSAPDTWVQVVVTETAEDVIAAA